ncbi:unnamed protein product [Paramecium pentaurelia]|uniref:Uncharacterized protein n=1 Tax=Paramecium pentaurelia TaxID=43138 RepID=A0A8S1XN07_9CILI|nr:unnamed protein product [Paramecium pentaurelia]
MPYLLDEIDSATVYKRPKEANFHCVDHWGIVVTNKSGSYLVHNMPETGTVATPASNMSNNWKKVEELQVRPNKNIRGMFKSIGLTGAETKLPNGSIKYCAQYGCIVAKNRMKKYLTK